MSDEHQQQGGIAQPANAPMVADDGPETIIPLTPAPPTEQPEPKPAPHGRETPMQPMIAPPPEHPL